MPVKKFQLHELINRDMLLRKIHVNREEAVLMFCPICIELRSFIIERGTNPESSNYFTRAICKKCQRVFINSNDFIFYKKSIPPRSLENLIDLNHELHYYQRETGFTVIEDDEDYLEDLK